MAKFTEGQRVRVLADITSAPKALRGQVGVVESVVVAQVPASFMVAHALEDQAEQKYDVKFDNDDKVRQFQESQLESA